MKTKLATIAGVIGLASVLAFGADIFVSPSGNDANDGSIGSPLKTLTAARDKADQLKAGTTPVTVYLRAGTYYLGAPVEFKSSNSGSANAPIVYAAYQKEKAVISGGIKVTGSWTTHSGSIMVTTIEKNLKVDQLFLNGKRQILARYPNYSENKILDGFDGGCLSHADQWDNPAEGPGYIRALHDGGWGGQSYIMTGKRGSSVSYRWVGDNNRGSKMSNQHRMIENNLKELDAAGEWYYRKSSGQLFFYPPSGTDLGSATIELASLDELIRVVGASTSRPQYITFRGLTFTHVYRTLFSKPYDAMLRGDWCIVKAGAIYIENAEYIRVEHCFFDQIGGNGVYLFGYNRKHVVFNNNFQDAGASCVILRGSNNSNRCPATNYDNSGPCSDHEPGPKTDEYPAYCLVDNNMMYNFGRFEKQTAGVCLSQAMDDTIRHNTVWKMPRAGINFTDGCYGGHVIEYNWVKESVLETGDHGPFNAWGRDRISRWSGDLSASKLDAWHTTIIRYNRFETKPNHFGIDLDDQATNYYQESNLCIGGGLKLQWNRYNTYVNNIMVAGGTVEIHTPWENTNHYLTRNVFAGDPVYCVIPDGNWNLSMYKARISKIDSNIIWNGGNNPRIGAWWDRSANVFWWNDWKNTGGFDRNSKIDVNPQFKDAAKGDYTVTNQAALAFGFKNFPMDKFGVQEVTVGVNDPSFGMESVAMKEVPCTARYRSGKLVVSAEGEYRVTVTTALGRTVKTFEGKGASGFSMGEARSGAGVYFALIQTNRGTVTRRFMVH